MFMVPLSSVMGSATEGALSPGVKAFPYEVEQGQSILFEASAEFGNPQGDGYR